MRTARNLKKKMFYALQGAEVPVYVTDDDGNYVYYTYADGTKSAEPMTKDETEIVYGTPVEMYGSLSFSGGEAVPKEYGIDVSGYDSVLITQLNAYPLSETSVIWTDSDIIYKDNDKTVPDEKSADFRVVAVKPSIGISKYLLKKIVK